MMCNWVKLQHSGKGWKRFFSDGPLHNDIPKNGEKLASMPSLPGMASSGCCVSATAWVLPLASDFVRIFFLGLSLSVCDSTILLGLRLHHRISIQCFRLQEPLDSATHFAASMSIGALSFLRCACLENACWQISFEIFFKAPSWWNIIYIYSVCMCLYVFVHFPMW